MKWTCTNGDIVDTSVVIEGHMQGRNLESHLNGDGCQCDECLSN